jgi:predicted AlkP superfamily pyrophosphatase or phosphodiesterase
MRKLLLAVVAAVFTTVSAQPAAALKLVVISIDQFSANLWDEYRPNSPGLARLAEERFS